MTCELAGFTRRLSLIVAIRSAQVFLHTEFLLLDNQTPYDCMLRGDWDKLHKLLDCIASSEGIRE